jgi:hypothetical protein
LRKHLAAGDAGPHAEELRSELAKTFSLDGTTLAPLPGEELRSLLVRIAHFGIAGERHEAERKMLHRVRLLRGV